MLLPHLTLALLSTIFFGDVLCGSRVFLPTRPTARFPWSLAVESREAETRPSNELMSDSLALTVPWRAYNAQRLREGSLPLWNPLVFTGYPQFALVQSNSLYPLSVPFDLIDPLRGVGWCLALHLAIAGSLMFAWLRRVVVSAQAALVGATCFAFNGMFLVRLGAPSYVLTGVWMPLFLLAVEDLAETRTWRRGFVLFAIATFLAFLGGHPQLLVLELALALSYGAVLQWRTPATVRSRWRTVFGAPLAIGLGLGLAGFQLLPFLELLEFSARESIALDAYRNSGLPLGAFLQALVPDVFGHPVDGTYWLGGAAASLQPADRTHSPWEINYCGSNVYTGLFPVMLAALALARGRAWRTWFFAVVALGAVGVSAGTPLLDAAYHLLPGFRFSRPDRIVFLYMVAVSVLAAFGCVEATGARSEVRTASLPAWLALGGVAIAGLLAALLIGTPEMRSAYVRFGHAVLAFVAAHPETLVWTLVEIALMASAALAVAVRPVRDVRIRTALILVALCVPLFRFGWRFNPTQREPVLPSHPIAQVVGSSSGAGAGRLARLGANAGLAWPANTAQLDGIADVNGASAAMLGAYAALIDAADPGAVLLEKSFPSFRSETGSVRRLLDLLSVRYLLTERVLPLPERWRDPRAAIRIYENPSALPRFFVVHRVELYADEVSARRRALDSSFDLRAAALVRLGQVSGLAGDGAGPPAVIRVNRDEPEHIAMTVTTSSPGLLVTSDAYYPGWRARVDGRAAPLVIANTAFRSVPVPAGTHEVQFRFQSDSLHHGAMLSIVSLVALLALLRRSGGGSGGGAAGIRAPPRILRATPATRQRGMRSMDHAGTAWPGGSARRTRSKPCFW